MIKKQLPKRRGLLKKKATNTTDKAPQKAKVCPKGINAAKEVTQKTKLLPPSKKTNPTPKTKSKPAPKQKKSRTKSKHSKPGPSDKKTASQKEETEGGKRKKTGKFTENNYRKSLIDQSDEVPANTDAHHVLSRKFEAEFEEAGINIHDPKYLAWWQKNDHRSQAKAYNKDWEEFFGSPQINQEQIFQKARELMEKYQPNTKLNF